MFVFLEKKIKFLEIYESIKSKYHFISIDNIDNYIDEKSKYEALIKDIPIEDELYIFNVELSSDLTKTFEIGSCKYSYG